ncbi:MAG: protein kinase [Myxococcales bacterium]|nr:protein kinase [Myxococcales bacterium]
MNRPPNHPAMLCEGRYELLDVLGKGGMAYVYRATDHKLGVQRAIKVLNIDEDTERPGLRKRLRSEARAMAQLEHPNVLRVYDIGADGALDFIVMDFAPGGSLKERQEMLGVIPVQQAVGWMVDVLSALAKAHEQAIVHRDVKPQNILLDAQDRPLLADFGIAMLAADAEMRRTRTGISMGSMAYMPPEQRLDAAHVNHKADIYATGATLYRLLTAESSVDLFLAGEDSPRWEGLPEGVAPVIRRACAARPEQRYESAGEMASALLERYPQSSDTTATPVERSFPEPSRELPPDSTDSTGKGRRRSRSDLSLDAIRAPVPTRGPTDDTGPTLAPTRRRGRWVAAPLALLALLLVALLWARPWSGTSASLDVTPEAGVLAPVTDVVLTPDPKAEGTPDEPIEEPVAEAALPTPAPSPRRATPPAAGPTPTGSWSMNHNGVRFTLQLSGTADALTGTTRSELKGKSQLTEVRGSYDPRTRSLELAEPSTESRYLFTLDESEAKGEGRFEGQGQVRSLTIKRDNP